MEEFIIFGLLAGGGYLIYKQTQASNPSSNQATSTSSSSGNPLEDLFNDVANGTTSLEDVLDGSGGVSNPGVTTTNGTESDLTTDPQNDALNNLLASSDPLSSGDPTL